MTGRGIGASPLVVRVRRAHPADLPRVRARYAAWRYGSDVALDDTAFIAEDDEALVGLVRLVQEQGVLVLRGMRVVAERQRQGVGTRLLHALVADVGTEACFCIPYPHLVGFYGRGGFVEIDPADAPAFLGERLTAYRRTRAEERFTLMCRPPNWR
jgi:N-acetylglutamate synthase-like GNAT family acetyltransferase